MRASPAANQNGDDGVSPAINVGSESLPPIYGPMMNPSPKAAPIIPKLRDLFSGIVRSAIAACATTMLPPVIPAKNLDTKRSGIFLHQIPRANRT